MELRAALERARPYLGLSYVGESCERKIWLRFRWGAREEWTAETLKRFEDGHRTEALWIERLKLVDGLELLDTDPNTGEQWEVDCADSHSRGHMDGAILGLLQAPKTWHVFEAKCSEEKQHASLRKAIETHGEKGSLKQWNATYYGQAQCYMGLTGMERHYLLVSLPGGRGTPITVRTEFNKADFERLMTRASKLAFANEPPERIGSSTFFECRWCSFHAICHTAVLPARNCRTCLHSSPIDNGEWRCGKFGHVLSVKDQEAGCQAQRYIPSLLTGRQQIDVRADSIVYRMEDGAEWVDSGQPD